MKLPRCETASGLMFAFIGGLTACGGDGEATRPGAAPGINGPTSALAPEVWIKCADEWGICALSGTAQVRYGFNGTYTTRTATGSISCSNDVFGDPLPGADKICEYESAGPSPTPTPTPAPTPVPGTTVWTKCADEWQVCSFSGTTEVRYGLNGTYATRTATGSVGCNNTVFGDPLPGADKICEFASATPSPTPPPEPTPPPAPPPAPAPGTSWTHCANEWMVCSFSGTAQVRYGLNGTYAFRTATGSIGCNNDVFGDPYPGVDKICEYEAPTPAPPPDANVIQRENAKTAAEGVTGSWIISDASYASNGEIEGYASATSVNRGESIKLYVSTSDPSYTISVYRMGWYGGMGGRLVTGPVTRTGMLQPPPTIDSSVRLVECDWGDPYLLDIPGNSDDPTDWASGIYLAKLTGSSGKQSYIVFTVRDDLRNADLLFQQSVTTYAAYNNWGGYNFYDSDSAGGKPAYKLSFDRPYRNPQQPSNGKGAGDFFSWEAKLLRFLEREGYDVSYSTNIDTDTNPARILTRKGFLSVGHDEYWTRSMRDAIESARNAGVNLGFLGANMGYWQVRLESSTVNARPNRVVVGYKYDAPAADPLFNTNPAETTYLFRAAPINRPESALIGVMYDYNSVDLDMIVADCTSWICNKTSLQTGAVLRGMLGYEVDRLDPVNSPQGITVVASSPYAAGSEQRLSSMTYYTHGSGALVFATGSMQWTWGLDSFGQAGDRVNPDVQQITRNVLDRFAGK